MVKSREQEIRNKQKIFEYANKVGNISKACRYYGISRETYYEWQRRYKDRGESGLINDKPGPKC